MADSNNNSHQEEQTTRSTDSNLPILFANGYPTSLEKMSREQLECFIPFLVNCSSHAAEEETPKWWPNSIDFKIPLEKPKNLKKNWEELLRKVVESCYKYHNQPFLLQYSQELCKNEPANLRYVTASDSTTSLYSRDPKKLLLTFRNENMLYDKKKRMTLWKKDESPSSDTDEGESTFNVMLCDYCDAEFYSDEAFTKHEEKCGSQVEQEIPVVDNIVISDDEDNEDETDDIIGGQTDFMLYFSLGMAGTEEPPRRRNNSMMERSLSPKKKKQNHRTRKVIDKKEKDREKLIPFSSPAGLMLTKKAIINDDYKIESIMDYEHCSVARQNTKVGFRARQKLNGPENAVMKEMRKMRNYSWPRKTFKSLSADVNFKFLNRSLIEEMKPCSVVMDKLTRDSHRYIQEKLKIKREEKQRIQAAEYVNLCSDSESDSDDLLDGSKLEDIDDSMSFQGEFVTMSFERSTYQFKASDTPTLPPFMVSQAFQNSNEFFLANRPEPNTSSSTITSSQVYQQIIYNTPTTLSTRSKRQHEDEDPETQRTKQSIQNWVKNVNGENFCIQNNQPSGITN